MIRKRKAVWAWEGDTVLIPVKVTKHNVVSVTPEEEIGETFEPFEKIFLTFDNGDSRMFHSDDIVYVTT